MKISVITLHRVRNYGSSLQTLATQLFLEEKKCKVEIIDYYQERYTSLGLLKRLKNKSVRLKRNPVLLFAAQIAISFSYLKKKKVFDDFLNKYIKVTDKTFKSEYDLLKNCPIADAYCTGSDQVWNSHWNEGIDSPMYLSFLPDNAYRFSYASSIGNSKLNDSEKNMITPYLQKYKHITVRENIGVDILCDLGINNVEQMIDPTLLFNKEQWNKFTSDKYKSQKYVLTYNLHHDSRIDKYANKLAKKHGLKVYNISYNWHDVVRQGTLKWCPKVEDYLGLIREAQYVVTDSFHATVFSLIYGTKFIDIFPEEASSRLRSLLTLTDTEDRGFDEMPSLDAAESNIDFENVYRKINLEQRKSSDYFDKIIEEISSIKRV